MPNLFTRNLFDPDPRPKRACASKKNHDRNADRALAHVGAGPPWTLAEGHRNKARCVRPVRKERRVSRAGEARRAIRRGRDSAPARISAVFGKAGGLAAPRPVHGTRPTGHTPWAHTSGGPNAWDRRGSENTAGAVALGKQNNCTTAAIAKNSPRDSSEPSRFSFFRPARDVLSYRANPFLSVSVRHHWAKPCHRCLSLRTFNAYLNRVKGHSSVVCPAEFIGKDVAQHFLP